MHHPTDRITHTTAFVTPVVEHWLEREACGPSPDYHDNPTRDKDMAKALQPWAKFKPCSSSYLLLIPSSQWCILCSAIFNIIISCIFSVYLIINKYYYT